MARRDRQVTASTRRTWPSFLLLRGSQTAALEAGDAPGRGTRPGRAALPAGGLVNLLSGLSSARLVCHTRRMNTPAINRYKNRRFPVEIISHAVWLYFRFCLSYRDVEELLFGVHTTFLQKLSLTYYTHNRRCDDRGTISLLSC
jgi:hypothetical protein